MEILKKLISGELKLSQALYYVTTIYRESFETSFIQWAEQECYGYKDSLKLPDYRYINCEVYAKYIDNFGNEHDEPIDVKAIDDYLLKNGLGKALVSRMRITQGMESIEDSIIGNNGGSLIMNLLPDMSEMIKKWYLCPAGCHSFSVYQSCHIEKGNNIITEVKTKLITTLKGMEQKFDDIGSKIKELNKPLIFISHASKDKLLVKSFVDNILKKGLGLKDENIVFTSYEATGVVPGDNIPNYIKQNIEKANIVLAMVSHNYKASEVCMNEVGAAFALDKTLVQIMLPNTNIDKLGWLIHLDKAARIDNRDSLDSLEEVICKEMGLNIPIAKHWNPCTQDFLDSLKSTTDLYSYDNPLCTVIGRTRNKNDITKIESKSTEVKIESKSNLHLFDTRFLVRAKTEGEYQYQLNIRFRAEKKVVLKEIYLVNYNDFTGNVSQPMCKLPLSSFISQGILDIEKIKVDEFEKMVISTFKTEKNSIIDFTIEKDGQKSLSFIGGFYTIHESDGYEELPMNHWSIMVNYNIDEVEIIPIKMTVIGDFTGYYWQN